DRRLRPRPAGPLQVPGHGRARSAAEDLDRQGAEIRAARGRVGRPRQPDRSRLMAAVGTAVRFEIDGAAATVTLDRPEKRNALSLALMEELIAALGSVSRTPGVRAIVLAAAGPAFSAGHDLSEMVGRDRAFYDR